MLVTPAAVELSVWIGLLSWDHPVAMRIYQWGIISLAVTKMGASSDLAANAMTNLMVWAMERLAPLKRGKGSFSERKI